MENPKINDHIVTISESFTNFPYITFDYSWFPIISDHFQLNKLAKL